VLVIEKWCLEAQKKRIEDDDDIIVDCVLTFTIRGLMLAPEKMTPYPDRRRLNAKQHQYFTGNGNPPGRNI
jgi:hypothetical protein